MTLKIIFLLLSVLCGGATVWTYKKGDVERDDIGLGFLCIFFLALTVIFAFCAHL